MTSCPVFDYYPRGTPVIMTDHIEKTMEAALDDGNAAGVVHDIIENKMVQELRNNPDYRTSMREAYREAGVDIVSPTMGSLNQLLSAAEGIRQDISRWQGRIDAADWLEKITGPEQAGEISHRDHVGVVLNVQNLGSAVNGNVSEVDRLYDFGVRIAQLTYNPANLIGSGCTERIDGGLTNHGVNVVNRCNELGMIIDLSHCGKETTLDSASLSEDPVAITHSFAESLADHDRAKSDEELRAVANNDGYVGVLAVPFFLDPGNPQADFELIFEHIDYMIDILGIDNVGIGTDWGTWTTELPEPLRNGIMNTFSQRGFGEEHGIELGIGFGPMQRYEDWSHIIEGLAAFGYGEKERKKLLGGNFIDFWKRVVSN